MRVALCGTVKGTTLLLSEQEPSNPLLELVYFPFEQQPSEMSSETIKAFNL